jgi:hypothetical protein
MILQIAVSSNGKFQLLVNHLIRFYYTLYIITSQSLLYTTQATLCIKLTACARSTHIKVIWKNKGGEKLCNYFCLEFPCDYIFCVGASNVVGRGMLTRHLHLIRVRS